MSSIQTLHEILWNLSEIIWKNIEEFSLVRFRETIPEYRVHHYWWIHDMLNSSQDDLIAAIVAIKEDDLYNQSLKEIVEKYDIALEDARYKLNEFLIGMIIRLVVNNESKYISQQLAVFMDELEENPVRYSLTLYLDKISSESEELVIELGDNYILSSFKDRDWIDFKIEGTIEGKNINDAEKGIKNIIDTLRLYGHAGIEIHEGNIYPDCFLQKYVDMNAILSDSPFELEIDKKGAKELQKFFNKFYPLIINARVDTKLSYIDIALQRFAEALVRRGSHEQRITYAITSLEAMLLKPKEREGLSRRLGQRIAGLLGLLGNSPADVYDTVLQSYDVRSTYIHGGKIEEEIGVEAICEKILWITRDCLISFLQLMEHNKDKIINLLDKAILDEKMKEKLGELLKDIEIVPIPS